MSAVAVLGVAALFGHSSGKGRFPVAASISWMILTPVSDPQSWSTLARIGDGLTVVSDRVGRLAMEHSPDERDRHRLEAHALAVRSSRLR